MVSLWKQEAHPIESRLAGFAVRVGPTLVITPNDTQAELVRLNDGNEQPWYLPYKYHKDRPEGIENTDQAIINKIKDPTAPIIQKFQQPVRNDTDINTGFGAVDKHAETTLTTAYKIPEKPISTFGNGSFHVYRLEKKVKYEPILKDYLKYEENPVLKSYTQVPVHIENDRKRYGKDCHLITYGRPIGQSRDAERLITRRVLVSIPIRDVNAKDCIDGVCHLSTMNPKRDVICHDDKGSVVHCRNDRDGHWATHIVAGRRGKHCSHRFQTAHLAHFNLP